MTERDLFIAALQKTSTAERRAFLQEACSTDDALRRQVEDLLKVHESAGSFLESPPPGMDATADPCVRTEPGVRIGPYKLLQQIGEGGMGTVYMAEQTHPVQRLVALKLIKSGLDSEQVSARFEAERQALALMDHPHIAQVLDAGTTADPSGRGGAGRPFIVMELVKGVPITRYCNEHRLALRQRLELFIPVCQAVQHAHQKGIIHRDLKPSNVLLALYDGKPVPKVIDFGVAKAVDTRLTERTLFTEFGAVIGTPEYMAPEQAELNQLDVDTRSDIYSLGVLLYELLTGTTPLEQKRLQDTPLLEVLRRIREEEPPRPSARLAQIRMADCGWRSSERSRWFRCFRPRSALRPPQWQELDWIVMKCLEKDRNRRYEAASALAVDLQHYLADEPVLAGPPGTAYRLRKFLRRNRGPVLAGVVVLLALVLGVVGTSIGLIVAERARQAAVAAEGNEREQRQLAETARRAEAAERDRAEKEKQIAQAVRDFLRERLLGQADANHQARELLGAGGDLAAVKENLTIRELLDRAARGLTADRIEGQFPGQPLVQAEILHTVGIIYRAVGDNGAAAAHLKRALALREQQRGPDDPLTLHAWNDLALTYLLAGDVAEAVRLFEDVLARRSARLGADHVDTLTTQHHLAEAYQDSGNLPAAVRLLEQVRDRWTRDLGPDHRFTLVASNTLAGAYLEAGRLAEAVGLLEELRAKRTLLFGPDYPGTLSTLQWLAKAYLAVGKVPDAIRLLEEVRDRHVAQLGADHPTTLGTLSILATAYRAMGRFSEALGLLERVRDQQMKKLGPDHPNTLGTLSALAVLYRDVGQLTRAIEFNEQTRDREAAKLGPNHPQTLRTLGNLAGAYLARGSVADAIRVYEDVVERQVHVRGQDHPETLRTLNNLAVAYRKAKQYDRAGPLFERVLDKQKAVLGPDHPDTLRTMANLAVHYGEAGRVQDAVPLMEDALNRARKFAPPMPLPHPRMPQNLAELYDRARRYAQSEPLRREFLQQARRQFGADHAETASCLATLGDNLLKQDRPADAEPLLRECLTIRTRIAPDNWTTYNSRSQLGGALLGQEKYAEAELLLLAGYEGLRQRQASIPESSRGDRLAEALDRLMRLEEVLGRKDRAEAWRKQLEEVKAAAKQSKPGHD